MESTQQFFKQSLGEVAFVPEQFAKESAKQLGDRLAVIDIPRCQDQIEQFSAVIENQPVDVFPRSASQVESMNEIPVQVPKHGVLK